METLSVEVARNGLFLPEGGILRMGKILFCGENRDVLKWSTGEVERDLELLNEVLEEQDAGFRYVLAKTETHTFRARV